MPVISLNPTAEGTYTGFTNSGGANKTASVTDAVDSNFVWRIDNSAGYQSFVTEDLPSHAVDINSVEWMGRLGRSGIPTAKRGCFASVSGLAGYATGENYNNDFPPNWTDVLNKDIPTDPSAAPWTVASVNAAQVGIGSDGTGGGGNNVQCTRLYLSVDYVPATGGFAYLIGQWILPLLGAAIPFASMREIARMVRLAGGPRIKKSELEKAWRELVEHPWRVYSCG